ncbi:MAG: hypothetical protein AB4368_26680 [Xenococcaceae cyanobacterium]
MIPHNPATKAVAERSGSNSDINFSAATRLSPIGSGMSQMTFKTIKGPRKLKPGSISSTSVRLNARGLAIAILSNLRR